MTDYVIDTCILVKANNTDTKKSFQVIELLIMIYKEHKICLDKNREILNEYERNGIYEGLLGEWFKSMQRAAKIRYVKQHIKKDNKN